MSGFSRGFGFVEYATLDDAAKGIEGMDGKVSSYLAQYFHVALIVTATTLNYLDFFKKKKLASLYTL